MKIIEQQQVNDSLNFDRLIKALSLGFSGKFGMPQRQVFELDSTSKNHDAFAVLPAWNEQVIGVKSFTYFPNNASDGYDSLYSKIMLFDRQHGVPLALVDGTSVTLWRTAAISALASKYLSRPSSETMVFFGTGNLASYMINAHLSVRTLKQVTIVGRNPDKVSMLIARMIKQHPQVKFISTNDTEQAVRGADIISCATASSEPLVKGEWLKAGAHLDLVGNHHSVRRECDTQAILNSAVFVDSASNVLNEAGELLIPISEGVFKAKDIQAQLSDLCAGKHQGRSFDQQITLFKAVGTALSDLITAHLVYQQQQ